MHIICQGKTQKEGKTCSQTKQSERPGNRKCYTEEPGKSQESDAISVTADQIRPLILTTSAHHYKLGFIVAWMQYVLMSCCFCKCCDELGQRTRSGHETVLTASQVGSPFCVHTTFIAIITCVYQQTI